MNLLRAASLLPLLVTAVPASSRGDTQYDCVILSAETLTDTGTLEPHWSLKSFLGEKFTIDRKTGRIIGGPVDNARMNTEVIDEGSSEMPFQALSRSTVRTHTTYLQVQEFVSGQDKPFLGTTTVYFPGVYAGTCS
jgi:hypothetical protein